MKKIFLFAAVAALMMTSCGTNGSLSQVGSAVLTDVLTGGQTGATTTTNTGNAVNTVLQSVLGMTGTKVSKQSLIGTWKYSQPGCAFTSEKLLAQAGGEVAAKRIEDELQQTYTKLGINGGNTSFTFNQDKTFSANIGGKKISGTYVYNKSDSSIKFKTLLLSTTGYVTRNAKGVSLVFESKKLLSVLQMLASVSGNSTLSTIGDLSKNYDGVRLGFDLRR